MLIRTNAVRQQSELRKITRIPTGPHLQKERVVGRNHANLAPIYFISDAFFPANFFCYTYRLRCRATTLNDFNDWLMPIFKLCESKLPVFFFQNQYKSEIFHFFYRFVISASNIPRKTASPKK
jgi:hypothetical protein